MARGGGSRRLRLMMSACSRRGGFYRQRGGVPSRFSGGMMGHCVLSTSLVGLEDSRSRMHGKGATRARMPTPWCRRGLWHAVVSPGRPVIAPWLGRRCAFLSVVFVEGIEVLG